jgi:hypothetical protein
MMNIIILAVIAARTAMPACAYDSSGGRVTAKLLARVQFQEAPSSMEPVRFAWDDAAKSAFRLRFRQILEQMPFDVARLNLSDLRRIDVSNAWYTVPAKTYKKIERSRKPADDYPAEAELGSCVYHRELHLTGDDYLDVYIDGNATGDEFPFTVLHELLHVWEIGRHPKTYRPEKTRSFYDIRFDGLRAEWEQAKKEARRPFDELYARLDNEYAADAQLPPEARRWKTREDFESDRSDQLTPLAAAAGRGVEEARQRLGIPTRFGGDSGRKLSNPWFRADADVHAMDLPTEYLAILVELLWKDPAWAATQYTPEEIAWVKHNVFDDRPILPWRPPEAQSKIDLSAKSAALDAAGNDIASSLQRP